MDIKVKYHYTYFLNPFVVEEEKYEQFLNNLIKDEKWNYRLFDKAADMEIFTHFLTQTKKFMFESFYWTDEYKKKIADMDSAKLAKEFADIPCMEFICDLNDDVQMSGKIEDKNQIYFDITEIKLICFSTGICFMVFKTNLVDDDYISFRELLNFNHKFKELSSNFAEYKEKGNIHIQTSKFDNMKTLSEFISSVTAGYAKLYNEDIYSDRMFVYSYACIDEADWNAEKPFERIEDNFYKYVFQFSGDYDSDIELSKEEYDEFVYSKWKYSKYGFTKLGGVVFTSAIDHFNFTKLPVHYEKVSLYIMILAFYKRIALLVLNNEILNAKPSDMKYIKAMVTREMAITRFSQISNSSHGMSLWKNWLRAFEIEELYKEIDKQYERMLNEMNTRKINLFFGFVSFMLALILAANTLGWI